MRVHPATRAEGAVVCWDSDVVGVSAVGGFVAVYEPPTASGEGPPRRSGVVGVLLQ